LAAITAVILCVITAVASSIAGDDLKSPAFALFAVLAPTSFAIPPIGFVLALFALRHPYRRWWVGVMLGIHFLAHIVSFKYLETILH
jgi:hypothetical protein